MIFRTKNFKFNPFLIGIMALVIIMLVLLLIFHDQYFKIIELSDSVKVLTESHQKLTDDLCLKDSRIQKLENNLKCYLEAESKKESKVSLSVELLGLLTFLFFRFSGI